MDELDPRISNIDVLADRCRSRLAAARQVADDNAAAEAIHRSLMGAVFALEDTLFVLETLRTAYVAR